MPGMDSRMWIGIFSSFLMFFILNCLMAAIAIGIRHFIRTRRIKQQLKEEKAKNTEGIIWDEENLSLSYIDKWNAYYGDTGTTAMECASRKIPVMLENVKI